MFQPAPSRADVRSPPPSRVGKPQSLGERCSWESWRRIHPEMASAPMGSLAEDACSRRTIQPEPASQWVRQERPHSLVCFSAVQAALKNMASTEPPLGPGAAEDARYLLSS
ncbi:predicted protein [Histoplasma capsulatum G186AR]|uniref:Uncharacterized protein n=1 Tax=Ajellomyces capsulatus (strain G186AR / H82 / ATCC MYA-2454 / RMSCC 2432) TaxID=447093 RepID=C0NWS3_AJECG|nr:uncharacterized protein HCBG_07603 [Histoplasma capsulatum G186AR]EEH04378.1 predicted protein [Histoplasma capsulatum G186AR]